MKFFSMVNCEQCNSHQFKLIKISANLQYKKCKTCGIEKINLPTGISLKAYFEEQQEHFYGQAPELTPLQKFCENDEANYHIKKLKKYLKMNPKVLEIGPGNGTFASKD